MTVQPQNTYQYYSGPITAGTTLSITDFAFASNSHVSVKIRGEVGNWLYGTDYLVEGENTAERSLIVQKDVAEGAVLAVYLDVPITQRVSPKEGGNFPAITQEFTLDKLTYICQMLDARLSRAFQVSIDTNFNGTLFDPTNKAGKAIKINSTGTGLEYSVEDIDTISATMRELFNQVTVLHDETGTWKDLAKDWATKISGEVVEGQGYSAKKYADDAKQAVEGFDANVIEKTNTFNTNVTEKTGAFDTNVINKTNAFNTNATEKTGAFDTNATEKTNTFDTNAINKTNAFNTNATEKITLVDNLARAAETSATAAATSEANALVSETTAETYSNHSQIWAEGSDDQVEMLGGEHSAKKWAEEAERIISQGQVQADWEQSDNTKPDHIKNKPTKLSDFTDDLGTSPAHSHSQYLTLQDISSKEDTSHKGVANGYAELDNTGKVPISQLPELGSTVEITYADGTTADLETVKYQTESAFAGRTDFPNDQIEVVEYNGEVPLYFANVQTISASTNYTFDNNGTFCTSSSSVAKVKITDSNLNSVTVYDNTVRIPANCTFTSNQAGNFFFDNTYNGYLAGAVNNV